MEKMFRSRDSRGGIPCFEKRQMLARLALANHRQLALRLQARPAPADVNQNENCLGQPLLMKKHRDQRLIVGMNLCPTE